MNLQMFVLLVTLFSSHAAFADSAASVKPLRIDEFKRIAGERSVTIDASTKTAILDDGEPLRLCLCVVHSRVYVPSQLIDTTQE